MAPALHSYPVTAGSLVAIFRCVDGVPKIEGYARVITACDYDDFFQVRFVGEQVNRVRLVIPEFQADPDRALERLRQLLRGGDAPFDDFFPEADKPRSWQ
jgi:hypothetical protein